MIRKSFIWHVALIGYIAFIFSNSLTPAVQSSAESGYVLRMVHQVLNSAGLSLPWLTEHIIRKCAHFAEYTLLGFFLWQSVKSLRLNQVWKKQLHLTGIFFIPFIDETLQLFTEGRSGQISDVWLDISGVVFGTALIAIFYKFLRNRKQHKEYEK